VADGAGAHGVVVPARGAAGLTPTVFKASAGAAEHVPVAQVANLTDAVLHLKRAEVWVGVAEANLGKPYYEERLTGPLALVLGSEGAGVSRPVAKHADFAVHIPLQGGVNSLNVSVATAVLCFERVRQQAQRR
jgi:23S rRNA (guanosine2251-2'-O)-methyltransferase